MNETDIHASCVVLARAAEAFAAPPDAGVLLLGESGAGKSTLALQLIERGARLVADDRTILFVKEDRLWARPPSVLAGLIEARNVGIIALPYTAAARIALVVALTSHTKLSRFPDPERYDGSPAMPSEAVPPMLRLATGDPAAATKLVLAVAAHARGLFRTHGNPK
jgi:hypothetical protein